MSELLPQIVDRLGQLLDFTLVSVFRSDQKTRTNHVSENPEFRRIALISQVVEFRSQVFAEIQLRSGLSETAENITEKELVLNPDQLRIGIGHDTHRLADGGPLILGGISIAHDRHAVGHSDADALLHAITDALLGAASLGDIGRLFPNDQEINRDRDSAEMLAIAWKSVQQAGWQLVNLDCIVFAQRPKISPHHSAIQTRVAEILDVRPTQIGLKAKTGEGVDAVGAEQAIQAQCIALLFNDNSASPEQA